MKKFLKIGICFVFLFNTTSFKLFSQTGSYKSYIERFKPLIDSLSNKYQIPVSVILGISIIESGMGKHRTAKLLNNYFGFVGKNDLLKTKGIKTKYKQYNSPEESFIDFCNRVSKRDYYKKLKGTVDYHPWLDAIAKVGYSTQPKVWKREVSKCIERHKLYLL